MIFRLAEPSDDSQLRALMREIVVPGHIQIAYTREPNFFNAYQDVDPRAQVIVAEENHRIEGVACCSAIAGQRKTTRTRLSFRTADKAFRPERYSPRTGLCLS
jgi:hypothetical protein